MTHSPGHKINATVTLYSALEVTLCVFYGTLHNVISSLEMLKPHWSKSSHVTGTINTYYLVYTAPPPYYAPTGAI